jgi:hypothetical protein
MQRASTRLQVERKNPSRIVETSRMDAKAIIAFPGSIAMHSLNATGAVS